MKFAIILSIVLSSLVSFAKKPTGFRVVPNSSDLTVIISQTKERIADLREVHKLDEAQATMVLFAKLLNEKDVRLMSAYLENTYSELSLTASFSDLVDQIVRDHGLTFHEGFVVGLLQLDHAAAIQQKFFEYAERHLGPSSQQNN